MICAGIWKVSCPSCRGEYRIDVQVTTSARFVADGTAMDEADFQDQEWDNESPATCHSCGHSGPAREFVTEIESDETDSEDEEESAS